MLKRIKEIFFINKKYIICLIIALLSIISIGIQHIDRKNSLVIDGDSSEVPHGKIAVYITGQITTAGVYYLDQDARLYNLIDLAGGLGNEADVDKINLAEKLKDGQKVSIPKKQLNEESAISDVESDTSKININTATLEQLKTLSGIGDKAAQKIIEYRKGATFEKIEDIMNVDGIGSSKYEAIKDYICVD